jgi:hypothetical protein
MIKKTILILAANPQDSDRIAIDREQRAIEGARRKSEGRDQFQVVVSAATQWDDVRQYLMEHEPTIVHFVGHGEGKLGLVMEREGGGVELIPDSQLAALFEIFACVQCVVLNACHSEVQANCIHHHVSCVVGMSQQMGDESARRFSSAFYDGIFDGWDYAKAFALGKTGILNPLDLMQPVLLIRENQILCSVQPQMIELDGPSRMSIEAPFYVPRSLATEEAYPEKLIFSKIISLLLGHVLTGGLLGLSNANLSAIAAAFIGSLVWALTAVRTIANSNNKYWIKLLFFATTVAVVIATSGSISWSISGAILMAGFIALLEAFNHEPSEFEESWEMSNFSDHVSQVIGWCLNSSSNQMASLPKSINKILPIARAMALVVAWTLLISTIGAFKRHIPLWLMHIFSITLIVQIALLAWALNPRQRIFSKNYKHPLTVLTIMSSAGLIVGLCMGHFSRPHIANTIFKALCNQPC